MRAIVQHGYGPPAQVLRLEDVDAPAVGDHDVLVRMRATSVNTPDWTMVAGVPYVLRARYGLRRPSTPVRGSDVAGVVEAVGAAVTDRAPGDEVVGSLWDPARPASRPGTFAELTAVPAGRLVAKPDGCTFEEAGALGMSGLTALAAMRDVGEVGPGTRVLVNGAAGGVGTFAVQIARALGAEVTGVCGTGNVELVRSLGAAHVIDHTREDFTAGGRRYDVVLDNVMNHRPAVTARSLAPGGRLVANSLGASGRLVGGLPRLAGAALLRFRSTDVRFLNWRVEPAGLRALAGLVASGDVRPVVHSRTPSATSTSRSMPAEPRGSGTGPHPCQDRRMADDDAACPCSSGAVLGACCGPIVRGERPAPTAERLMRSRFTAFALGDEAHLLRSWHPATRPDDVRFVPGPRWTGLEIVAAEAGGVLDAAGVVEFRAAHERGGRRGVLHERSRFVREGGRWVYVGPVGDPPDGVSAPTRPPAGPAPRS